MPFSKADLTKIMNQVKKEGTVYYFSLTLTEDKKSLQTFRIAASSIASGINGTVFKSDDDYYFEGTKFTKDHKKIVKATLKAAGLTGFHVHKGPMSDDNDDDSDDDSTSGKQPAAKAVAAPAAVTPEKARAEVEKNWATLRKLGAKVPLSGEPAKIYSAFPKLLTDPKWDTAKLKGALQRLRAGILDAQARAEDNPYDDVQDARAKPGADRYEAADSPLGDKPEAKPAKAAPASAYEDSAAAVRDPNATAKAAKAEKEVLDAAVKLLDDWTRIIDPAFDMLVRRIPEHRTKLSSDDVKKMRVKFRQYLGRNPPDVRKASEILAYLEKEIPLIEKLDAAKE